MDQATHNKIVSFIWGIADDVLRDLFKRGKYPDVILPMCVLRRFDAVLEPTKQAVLESKAMLDKAGITAQHEALCAAAKQAFHNTSPFTLKDLASRASQQQLKADFEAYLDGFSANVQDILENFKFRNQISTLSKADALGTLINKFRDPEINLSPNPVLNGDGSIKRPGMDNHSMGTVFEELVRKFNEENNEEAGEHWTPRDAVKLMTNLIFLPIADQIKSGTYLLYDGACGTGGMLTLAEETLTTLAEKQNKKVGTNLYGQEINPETYAICKADMLLKGEGENAANIVGGAEFSTLSHDAFPAQEFDFMLSNPPYGKSWKKDLESMGGKDNMRDPRFQITHANDPEFSLITRSSDGQLLFLANMVSKMNHKTPLGSRIAEVHNGSSLFTGDAGQGESNIRRWIIENDWLEAIVALPLNLFYNTGIATYIWVLSNKKPAARKGQVQLIDATQWFKPLRKNLGKKNCELSPEDIDRICQTYLSFQQTEQSKIFPNQAFGYWKVTVERPLRLHSQLKPANIEKLRFASGDEEIRTVLYDEFGDALTQNFREIEKTLETRLAEWGAGDEEPESEDTPMKGLPEKKRKKLLDPTTWQRDAKLTEAAQYLREKLSDKPREPLFQFGRSVVHFAVDDSEVRMCTELKGKASWFLPFNQGWKHGAGNPPNAGVKTDYLWKEILAPASLTNILENYAQIVEVENKKTGRKKRVQVFPRYHQLKVVRKVLADVTANGPGQRYLLQHSAGSGKSNSIAWLAHQLIAASRDGKPVFDSIFVITDRRLLDRQIETTIKQFLQIGATVGYADDSGKLVRLIEEGKKIIISTVQKFPHLLKVVGDENRGRNFAIIIDEAHSSQGGESSASLNAALADPEDTINDALERRMQSRKMLSNSSYFAFTATPKPKTLEMFGVPSPQPDGEKKFKPFDEYTMSQAIDEGFILDVLQNYTPVESYYRLVKKVEDDPQFDAKRAKKKLRKYVEGNSHPIRLKAEIMVDHFHEQVLSVGKIGGKARAMVVSSGIERAIKYFHAFQAYLLERKSPYKAVVAFSGEVEYGGAKVTEASLTGFPSNDIADRFQEDPYRFLICADKFQTGYDEPLLHTMYVDKPLSGVKAVQTLSRLNRSHPDKRDVFVLDFMDNADAVTKAFSDYHCTTILSKETDPNKLHDLQGELDRLQVYTQAEIDQLVERFLAGEKVDALHPILDICVARYLRTLNEDGQVEFKGKAKGFTRTYDFLASVLPYTNASWEKLSIFLNMLIPKLPAPVEEDLSKGILDSIDMDSYRAEKKATMKILLPDADAEIDPLPAAGAGRKPEPELEYLSEILKVFNEQFGTLFKEGDRVLRRIKEEIAPRVNADPAYRNALENTPNTAAIELEKALRRVMQPMLKDDTEFYKQFVENPSFRQFVTQVVQRAAGGAVI